MTTTCACGVFLHAGPQCTCAEAGHSGWHGSSRNGAEMKEWQKAVPQEHFAAGAGCPQDMAVPLRGGPRGDCGEPGGVLRAVLRATLPRDAAGPGVQVRHLAPDLVRSRGLPHVSAAGPQRGRVSNRSVSADPTQQIHAHLPVLLGCVQVFWQVLPFSTMQTTQHLRASRSIAMDAMNKPNHISKCGQATLYSIEMAPYGVSLKAEAPGAL